MALKRIVESFASVASLASVGALAWAAGTLAVVSSTPACSGCPGAERTFTGGTVQRVGCMLHYESSVPAGPYLAFEGGALYHIKHGLGAVPWETHVDVAFSDQPESVGGGGAAAAAGNQALLLEQTADEVQVKNDTCSAFWMRVTVTAVDTTSPGCSDAGVVADGGSE